MTAPLRESVAFDSPTSSTDDYGGVIEGWTQAYTCRADFIYARGAEAVQAGVVTGTAVFKVKLRSFTGARAITTAWRMRDVRRSVAFNIREVDAISDRRWVWLVVESGVAI